MSTESDDKLKNVAEGDTGVVRSPEVTNDVVDAVDALTDEVRVDFDSTGVDYDSRPEIGETELIDHLRAGDMIFQDIKRNYKFEETLEIANAAIEADPLNYELLGLKFRLNEEVAMEAVRRYPRVFITMQDNFNPESYPDFSRRLVLAAVSLDGSLLAQIRLDQYLYDKDVIIAALEQNPNAARIAYGMRTRRQYSF